LADDTISWPDWLERFGKIELWAKFRTPEMERQWLSCRTLPGCTLSALAGFDSYIPRQVLGKIQFRADFHQGDKVTTIWLAQCAKSLLSDGEMRTLPGQVVEPSVPISVLGKKLDSLSADLKRIGDLKVEENYARDKWAENPLGSPEAVADYFLNMDVVKISRGVATALVRYGHGNTRKQCADEAGVSVATIKRALVKARQTPYAKFFARTRGQKLMARRSFKQLDEVYAWLRSMATANSEMLRSVVDQVIVKANAGDESGGANTWEKIVAELV